MIRTLLVLAAIYAVYHLYKRMFLEKRCFACKKQIRKEAAICYHCNTIQTNGIVIESENLKGDINIDTESSSGFIKQLLPPVAVALLIIIAAVAVAGIYFSGGS